MNCWWSYHPPIGRNMTSKRKYFFKYTSDFTNFTNFAFVLNLIESADVAQVVVETLWDAGFHTVTGFGEKNKPDVTFTSREMLFKYIVECKLWQQDFHFVHKDHLQ